MQKTWENNYKGSNVTERNECSSDECILFVDGLRFDCAKQLIKMLNSRGYSLDEKVRWAALPSVTGTGKPAVAPLSSDSNRVAEEPDGYNFEPMTSYQLRKGIEENGYQILDKNFISGNSSVVQKAWMEFGDIDHEGARPGLEIGKTP